MKRALVVRTGLKFSGSTQRRFLVAARTKKQACELAGITLRELNEYWTQTRQSLALATATTEGLWKNIGTEHEPNYERLK